MAEMNETAHHLALRAAPAVQFTSAMRFDMSGYRRSELAHILSADEAGYAKYEKLLDKYNGDLVQQRSAFESLIDSEQERRLLGDFNREWDTYLNQDKEVIAASRAGKQGEASSLIQGQTRIQFGRAEDVLSKLIDRETEKSKQAAANCDGVYSSARNWLLGAVFAFLCISITLAYRISKGITGPLNRLIHVAREIGESGNLEHEIDIQGKDEIGDLARSFSNMVAYLKEMAHHSEAIAGGNLSDNIAPRSRNDTLGNAFVHMTQGLASLVRSVRDSASQVASGSGQVALASDQSARVGAKASAAIDQVSSSMCQISVNTRNVVKNTQMQTSSVDETSAAIEQMVASIQRVADNSKLLLELSNHSRQETKNGLVTMEKATDGLNRINTSIQSSAGIIDTLGQRAEDIGKIVEVIDDLAEQTNLLALNAAIEAARAGEHGLGFAVVADEVRKLAEKSARSTKEISELILSIQKEAHKAVENMEKSASIVNEGLTLGSDLGAALEKISSVVTEVYSFAREIGVATDEQSRGSSQIANATSRLNEITRDIHASVEEQATGTAVVEEAMVRMRELVQHSTSESTELAASSEQMSKMARSLLDSMDQFIIDAQSPAAMKPALPRASGKSLAARV
jgi:methyl-accepting chemotaxis protein